MAFIVFEGLDGSGKTTQIHKLADYVREQGNDIIFTREPGGTPLAEELRGLLLRNDGEHPVPRCELLVYEAARAQHVEHVVRPAIERGDWVLCDRFTGSTVAFQSGGRGLVDEDIAWLNNYATGGIKPDVVVFIDISEDESEKRTEQRSLELDTEQDRLEKEKREFHQAVRNSYLKQAVENDHWLQVDGHQSVDEIFSEILSSLRERKCLS